LTKTGQISAKSAQKKENMSAILDALAGKKSVSRSDIAKMTGLSLMTVGKAADALFAAGILDEERQSRKGSKTGRLAGMLTLRDSLYTVIIFADNPPSAVITDIYNKAIDRFTLTTAKAESYDETLFYFGHDLSLYLQNNYEYGSCIGVSVISDITDMPPDYIRNIIGSALMTEVSSVCTKLTAALIYIRQKYGSDVLYISIDIPLRCIRLVSDDQYVGEIPISRMALSTDGRSLMSLLSDKCPKDEQWKLLAYSVYNILLITGCGTVVLDSEHSVQRKNKILFRNTLNELLLPELCVDTVFAESKAGYALLGAAYAAREDWIRRISY